MKRATTAVPAVLDAPTCDYRNRHGGRLTVPRGLGPPATHLRREMKRKATAAMAVMGLTASKAVRLLFHRIAVQQAFPLERLLSPA